MSTAPNAVAATPEVPPNISGGLTLLAKRLLPAKLKLTEADGKKNGHVFNSWAIAKGLRLSTMTPQAIADEFYKAAVADCEQPLPQLIWTVPPKTLLKRVEQSKAPPTQQSVQNIDDLASRKRESEEADERIKAQEAAKKRCQELIDRFIPTRSRRGVGVVDYNLQAKQQADWRKRLVSSKDFVKLEDEIRKEQRDIYEKLERASERI